MGFDPERLEVMHQTMRRVVAEHLQAGIITLLAREGKIAYVQTYGLRDVAQKVTMERDTHGRMMSMPKNFT